LITSKDNAIVKDARRLKEAKARKETGLFLAEGAHLVKELIASPLKIVRIFVSGEGLRREESEILNALIQTGLSVVEVSGAVLKSLSETETPQGILAVAEESRNSILPKLHPNQPFQGLILDRIQDPGNLGTLIRTAWGFGIDACVLIPGTADPYSGKVLRSSMGGTFHLPIITAPVADVIKWAVENEVVLYGGDMRAERRVDQASYAKRLGILVGNEGAGLSPEWYPSGQTQMVNIPMPGGAESLNVAVAASIMMYEVYRQSLR
jgi:TrmH family RNA methyltransferase